MDEKEKSRGISLRKKKTTRPKISAPKQISGPLPENLQGPTIPDEFRQKAQAAREQAAAAAAAGSGASAPSAPSAPSVPSAPSGGQPLDAPRERPQPAGGKTSDLVKRRYSTRFNQLPQDYPPGGPPLPAVPGIPKQFAPPPQPSDGRPSTSDGQRIKVDIKALRDPSLRPEQYVASLLADASEADITRYQEDLRKVKNRTSSDLQHNVYQNRTQFIKISKEADKLKGEMRTLRALMSDLTSTLGQATSSGSMKSADTGSSRRNANRSSVANLEALWNTHLQTLWKRVEGSQKFLPAIPGRHIVYESGRWVELNAATWKVRRRVHLILLNDHLLVAAEKKRAEGSSQNARDPKQAKEQMQLVAVRCWPLQDVQMVDLSTRTSSGRDQGEKKRAADSINVRVGAESFTFATNDQVEKATLLSSFRKAMEDLRKNLEAETEERSKTNDSVNYYATRDLSVLKEQDLLEGLGESASQNRSSLFLDVDGKRQSIRWVESQLDELDIDIALHRFEDAVEKVDRLRRISKNIKGNSVAQEIIVFKVNERAAKLAGLVTRQLQETHNWSTATKRHVDWLVQLGFEDRAREAYLEARSGIIRKRTRQCVFDGDLHQYIYQLSFIYFTIVRNTVLTYQSCFPSTMMSACVKWAKDHVEDFNSILSRQLSTIDSESTMWQECMNRAREHGAMLSEVGLDFKDLIGKGVGMRDSGIYMAPDRSEEPQGLGLST